MDLTEFKRKYNIRKLSYKETLKKAIERLSVEESWAAWYYDEVKLVYSLSKKK